MNYVRLFNLGAAHLCCSAVLVADCILKKAAVMAAGMLYILPIAAACYAGEGAEC